LIAVPFSDTSFKLALCSHFLFLYAEQLKEEFPTASILDLCRVAPEVRIFPLIEMGGCRSRHVEPVSARLRSHGQQITIETVPTNSAAEETK
jgi:hypothetical protein